MNTIKQLLQDADPLRHEGAEAAYVEKTLRDAAAAVTAASLNPASNQPLHRRRLLIFMVSALILGTSLIAPRVWRLLVQKPQASIPFEMRLAEDHPAPGLREAKVVGDGSLVYLHEEVIASNGDIRMVRVGRDENQRFGVSLSLMPIAGRRMLAATQAHIGRPMVILINKEVVVSKNVLGPFSDEIFISGNYTEAEAARIAALLR